MATLNQLCKILGDRDYRGLAHVERVGRALASRKLVEVGKRGPNAKQQDARGAAMLLLGLGSGELPSGAVDAAEAFAGARARGGNQRAAEHVDACEPFRAIAHARTCIDGLAAYVAGAEELVRTALALARWQNRADDPDQVEIAGAQGQILDIGVQLFKPRFSARFLLIEHTDAGPKTLAECWFDAATIPERYGAGRGLTFQGTFGLATVLPLCRAIHAETSDQAGLAAQPAGRAARSALQPGQQRRETAQAATISEGEA